MKKRASFFWLLILLLTSCAPSFQADQGRVVDRGTGIGGTGIGGTGILAGTEGENLGLIGRITGFGSIFVNGVEVEYNQATKVSLAGAPAGVGDLALGQVVEVLARNEQGRVTGSDIRIRYEVAGPVGAIDEKSGTIKVLGQSVIIGTGTIRGKGAAGLPSPGSVVRVSGFRAGDGLIFASRLEMGKKEDSALLVGRVDSITGVRAVVAGVPVKLNNSPAETPRPGDIIRISGRLRGKTLVAGNWQVDSRVPFNGRVDRFIIEAVPVLVRNGGQVYLAGMPFPVADPDKIAAANPARNSRLVRLAGTFNRHGVFQAVRVFMAPALVPAPRSQPPGFRPGIRPRPAPMMPRPGERQPPTMPRFPAGRHFPGRF
ncbi:hypothetical protein MNBD_DELTA04-1320 [hydrothermal vent metagenome]|uniref:DUF5666 domain-containing protein n=1 Tax=hydrothermal vent metagenome TaxID=652676 RepID=A0A3B0VAM1_9ZZZZ